MLFRFLLAVFILSIFAGAAFAAEEKATVTGSVVNIRSSPSLEAKVISKVARGQELEVLGQEGEWYRVKLPTGTVGWIAGSLVELKKQAAMTGVKIKVDGRLISFDVEPYIDAQSRTMVPIRFVANELGSQVFWKQAEQEVVITGNDRIIQLWIGQSLARVNGKEVAMDTVPVLKNGRTMVPLRFVSDNLGVEVTWDGATRTVLLQKVKAPGKGGETGTGTMAKLAVVTGNVVNIRSGPGLEYEVINQVVKGDALTVLGQSGDWFQVETRNGGQGWIANWLVVLRTVQNQASRSAEPEDRPRPAPPLYTGANKLLDIEAKDLEDGLLVTVVGAHPLNYSHFSLTNPRRLVLDFLNTTLELDWEGDYLPVNNELVGAIRVGQFTEDQARVVIDLKDLYSAGFSLSEDGKRLTVKIQPPTVKGKTIVIDPGHGSIQPGGWSDPGAVGPNGLYEKDVVLDIGLKVADLLTKEGASVVLTRTGNTVLSLAERAQVANEINADLFISIHANASPSPSLAGTATYYYAPWNSQLATQRAAREKLARCVQQELVRELQRRDIGILEENFSVLRNTTMPSVLVETAFISNPEEEGLLSQEAFRQKAAQAIVRGIIRFFAEP